MNCRNLARSAWSKERRARQNHWICRNHQKKYIVYVYMYQQPLWLICFKIDVKLACAADLEAATYLE